MIHMQSQGAVDVIGLEGRLDAEMATQLGTAMEGVAQVGPPMVVLDLTHVQLVDSNGLEALLDCNDLIRQCGGQIKLAAATPLVADVLRATGVDKRFEIFESTKLGIGSYAR